MSTTHTYLKICLVLFCFSAVTFAQNQSQITNLLKDNAEDILQFYHPSGGSYQDCSVSVEGNEATLTINYKGWVKKHKIRLTVTFDSNGPVDISVRSDTNTNKTRRDKKNNEALDYLIQEWEDKYK